MLSKGNTTAHSEGNGSIYWGDKAQVLETAPLCVDTLHRMLVIEQLTLYQRCPLYAQEGGVKGVF